MTKKIDLSTRVADRGLVTMTDAATWLAGGPIKGNWWGHPKGKAIYAALTSLDDDADILSLKLVDGKQTFVHKRLWPALVRVARARELWPDVSNDAKRLYAALGDGKPVLATGKPRLELERVLLVVGRSVHTIKGNHEIALMRLEDWVSPELSAAADALPLEAALAQLASVGFTPPPPRPRRDPRP